MYVKVPRIPLIIDVIYSIYIHMAGVDSGVSMDSSIRNYHIYIAISHNKIL